MKFIIPLFILFIFLSSPYEAFSQIPFEKCNWKNKEMTKNLVEGEKDFSLSASCPSLTCSMDRKSEKNNDDNSFIKPTKEVLSKNIPPECFFASAVHSVVKPAGRIKKGNKKDEPNYYYCQSAKDNKTTMLSVSDDKGKKRIILPRSPCLNEEYIMMTYKAFHEMADCFDFTPEDKQYLFKLFNHESHFILNNKSDTGARCYGQVTTMTFEEVNRRIYLSSNVNTSWKSQIYKDVVKKCSKIPEKVHIPNVIRPEEEAGARRYSGFEEHRSVARAMDCQLSQHAHTCFFYALYNMKMNIGFMKDTLFGDTQDIDSLVPQNREDIAEVVSKLKKDFLLPIRLNEVLVVKGVFTEEDGTKTQRSWVMKNDREMYYALFDKDHKSKRGYDIKDLEVRKVKLYDIDVDDKWDLLYKAYNGGSTVVRDKMQTFIEVEKAYIANGQFCKKNKSHFHCVKRRQILENKEYESARFNHKRFQRRMRLSGQTRRFVNSIRKGVDYLKDKGNRKLPKPLTHHLHKLHGINKGDKGEEMIKGFVQSVKDKCFF